MWSQGLFVIDSKKDGFAFRLSDPSEKRENVGEVKYPDFLKTSEGLKLALFRPDGTDRVARAFQQHDFEKDMAASSEAAALIGNLTVACDNPGQQILLRGHAYRMTETMSAKSGVRPSPTVITLALAMIDGALTITDCSMVKELCGSVVMEAARGSWYHPVYLNPGMTSLPRNMAEALELLELMPNDYPGISKLKEIIAAHSHLMQEVQGSKDGTPLKPFIVVEGMDATGKSTLVSNLCKKLGSIELCSPPPIMAQIRPDFDKYPTLIRRTYYSLGNYILGLQVANMRKEKPVVMDRYWHSTAAYSIASECRHGDVSVLPPAGHWTYQWPDDLHRPSQVIYLTVSEETRIARHRQRQRATSIATTAEEKWLGQSENLRKRIAASYQRMGGCGITEVDASGTKEDVLQQTLSVLSENNII